MKVAELTGPLLDYWTAKADGLVPLMEWYLTATPRPACVWLRGPDGKPFLKAGVYSPSTDWKLGGEIINRERISIGFHEFWGDGPSKPPTELYARAYMWKPEWKKEIKFYGPDALINAMRCFVASKFGEEVPDYEPKEP